MFCDVEEIPLPKGGRFSLVSVGLQSRSEQKNALRSIALSVSIENRERETLKPHGGSTYVL